MIPVTVVATGTANTASVLAALHRAGASPTLTTDRDAVAGADRLVLPGVGSFGAAMAALREHRLVNLIREHAHAERPLLAVCVGLQVLFDSSEESPGAKGLGVIPGHLTRFHGAVRVPQLGWNRVHPTAGARYLRHGYAAFANSYKLDALPDGWHGATADHGGPFVAALERGAQLACQFHPELSGTWGQALLTRWLESAC